MKNIYILAQAGDGEDTVITGGSGDDVAQENLIVEDGSNGGGEGEGGGASPKPFIPLPFSNLPISFSCKVLLCTLPVIDTGIFLTNSI